MTRRALDGSRWFDDATSTRFSEDSYHDGNNFISRATGSQWEHETLHLTAGGSWIVHHTSQWQGSTDSYTEVSTADAVAWIIQNDLTEGLIVLPSAVRLAVEAAIDTAEA